MRFPQASNSSGQRHGPRSGRCRGARGLGRALVKTDTNVRFETRTNEIGYYVFPAIIPGPLPARSDLGRHGQVRRHALLVEVSQKLTIDAVLKPGSTTTTVTVTDATPLVNVTDSTMSHVINRTQIDQLPRADRNLLNLMVTVPGVEGGGLRSSGLRATAPPTSSLTGRRWSRARAATCQYRQPGLDSIRRSERR